jgi:hypothetical protein
MGAYKKQTHSISMPNVRVVEELRHYPIAEEESGFFIEPVESFSSERSGYLPKTGFTEQQQEEVSIPATVITTSADTTRQQQQQQQQHEQVMNTLSGFFLGIKEEEVPPATTGSPTRVSGFVELEQAPVIASSCSCTTLQPAPQDDQGFVKLQSFNRTQSMPLTRKSSMKKLSSLGSSLGSLKSLKPSVSFASLSVREYNVMMGDNPSCSYGVPISLGWEYQQHEAVPVVVSQQKKKNRSNLLLSYNARRQLLKEAGYRSTELRKCVREVNRIKNERAMTEMFLAAQPLEDAMETVVHGVQNMLIPWKNQVVQSADI